MALAVSALEYTATASDSVLAYTAEAPQRTLLPTSPAPGQVITAFDRANRADWRPKIFVNPITGTVFLLNTAGGSGQLFWNGDEWDADSIFVVYTAPPPPAPTGTIYYVSPAGNDSHAGTSPATAWQTVDHARHATLSPGDALLFEGGQTFSDVYFNPGYSGTPWEGTEADPILIGSYGTGRAYLPLGLFFAGSQATWLIFDQLISNSWQIGTTGDLAENILSQRCELYQTSPTTNTSPVYEPLGSNINFVGGYIHDIGSHGIQSQVGSDTNTIADTLIYAIGLHPSLGFNTHHMYLNGSGHTVTGNACIGTLDQVLFDDASSAISARGHDTLIENNYVATTLAFIDFLSADLTAGTTQILNNTGRGIGTASGGYAIFCAEDAEPLIESLVIQFNDVEMVGTGNQLNIHPTTGTVVDTPNTFQIGGNWTSLEPSVLQLEPGPPRHFDAPFRLGPDGQVVTVEQGSPEEIGAAILNVISCLQGEKLEDPQFGIPNILFKNDVDLDAVIQAVQRLESRPDEYTAQDLSRDPSTRLIRLTAAIADATTTFTVPRVQPQPVTYTAVTVVGGLLMTYLAPWLTEALAWYCDAIGAILDPLYTLVMDQGLDDGSTPTVGTYDANGELVTEGYQPGWGALFNPQVASGGNLGYLGQFVGVPVPAGVPDATARSLVLAEAGRNRGTDDAVVAAAKRTLTGTQTVYYFRRTYPDGTADPGWAGLVMLTSECPSLAATKAAVEAVKLGGIMMWYSLISGWTIGALEGAYALVSDVEAAFVTINGIEGDITSA